MLVLLLTPEAYLPLRAVGAQFHASMEGAAAATRVFEILDAPTPALPQPGPRATALGHAARTCGTPTSGYPGSPWSIQADPAPLWRG